MTTIYKWVATTLMGEPAPEYTARALKAGWFKCEKWNTITLLEPFHRDGFDLYYRERADNESSDPHKRAVDVLLDVDNHYLREPNDPGRIPSPSGRSALYEAIEQYYRPENRALYPERQAEFEASEAALKAKELKWE
jgi:hypothetical protein